MKNKKYSDITVLKHIPAPAGERQNHLRVLTYHRISRMNQPANLDPRLISATAEPDAVNARAWIKRLMTLWMR